MENDNQNIQNFTESDDKKNTPPEPIPASNLPRTENLKQDSQVSGASSEEIPQANIAQNDNPSTLSSSNPFEKQDKGETLPPPPEGVESQVNVRTMNSDIESIKQTGGESPESEVVTAPIINPTNENNNEATEAQNGEAVAQNIPAQQGVGQNVPQPTQSQPESTVEQPSSVQPQEQNQSSPQDNKIPRRSGSIKTIFVIIGVIIIALAVGFGVYYLVSSLNSSPKVKKNNIKTSLPVSANKNNSVATTSSTTPVASATSTSTTTASSTSAQQAQNQSFIHKSFITNTTDSVSILLPAVTLNYIIPAISSKISPMLSDGHIRDIAFTTGSTATSSISVTSAEILKAYFPNLSKKLSTLFAKDFTAWIYYDNINKITPKFGLIFKLANGVSLNNASSVVSGIESVPDRLAKLFIQNVTTPPNKSFTNGKIMSVNIRFLRFSTGNVFEYGWLKNADGTFLIMGTSYKQMLDVISRLSQTNTK